MNKIRFDRNTSDILIKILKGLIDYNTYYYNKYCVDIKLTNKGEELILEWKEKKKEKLGLYESIDDFPSEEEVVCENNCEECEVNN